MFFVSGIDALWGVAHHKISSELQARSFFEDWNAVFFGATRVNCRFKHNVVAFFEHLANGAAGTQQGLEVGQIGVVDGCRDRHNKKGGFFEVVDVGGEGDVAVLEISSAELAAGVFAALHLGNTPGVDIKANDLNALGKFERNW